MVFSGEDKNTVDFNPTLGGYRNLFVGYLFVANINEVSIMKYILTILILLTQLVAYGQSGPDQQEIPDFVMVGKSASELRIMRNEIFARYGYIFESEDLAEYFDTKIWYNPKYPNVDDKLTEVDKANIKRFLKFENLAKQDSNDPSISNETLAYFRVIEHSLTGNRVEISRNVSYHRHFDLGTIRKIVERSFIGIEWFPTVIYAETIDPKDSYWGTTKYFDDLQFKSNFYKAINRGCCGSESYAELYSYESNDPILKYNNDYFTVNIPNSQIRMFVGYSHRGYGRDDSNIGTLYLGTLDGLVSSITFVGTSPEIKEDLIWYWSPKIEFRTENESNRITSDGQEIRLNSSNRAKSLDDINDFSIYIEYLGDASGKTAQFKIPVINGKLNGDDELHTTITVVLE